MDHQLIFPYSIANPSMQFVIQQIIDGDHFHTLTRDTPMYKMGGFDSNRLAQSIAACGSEQAMTFCNSVVDYCRANNQDSMAINILAVLNDPDHYSLLKRVQHTVEKLKGGAYCQNTLGWLEKTFFLNNATIPQSTGGFDGKAAVETKLSAPPERLRDALNYPDYIQIFVKIFLKLNEIDPKTNNIRWQLLKNQFLTVDFPQSLLNKLFSNACKNPSEELVTHIAKNTIITVTDFCKVLQAESIGLEKYAGQLMAIYDKCNEKFKSLSDQVSSNKSEIYRWCNQKDLAFLIPTLEGHGFRTLEDIADINDKDLQDMGINLIGHRKSIMRAISTLKVNSNN
jgi:hypothetical protein